MTIKPKAASAPAKASTTAAPKSAQAPIVTLKNLAAELADSHDLTKANAEKIVAGLVGGITTHLKSGARLRLAGLGVLEVKDRPARKGRNPATGAEIEIAASKKIAFRPAKELKDAI